MIWKTCLKRKSSSTAKRNKKLKEIWFEINNTEKLQTLKHTDTEIEGQRCPELEIKINFYLKISYKKVIQNINSLKQQKHKKKTFVQAGNIDSKRSVVNLT